ncbi:hypothetical protein K2173_014631 [Erythroxylum novogranatense]|uniref:Epidermal patterning factor-like protein n=1 Tax=Erythroxylum novogranatense TaxID=1862640 RepID=A0AAV8THM4_9ROSI|nr:hypothetical protein K2173_014631 [Erythroxylum novogranatense]
MSSHYCREVIAVILVYHLLSSSICCFIHQHQLPPTISPRGLLFEEKTRLGSTPPSCHNKCNGCHPCMAVQVPTLPSHNRVDPSLTEKTVADEHSEPSYNTLAGSRYSNYKPLGWKCRCGDHFYNP